MIEDGNSVGFKSSNSTQSSNSAGMKLVLALLACSLSVTIQQDIFWPSPYSWLPFFSGYAPREPMPPMKFSPAIAPNPRNRISQKDAIEYLKAIVEQKDEEAPLIDGSMVEGRVKNPFKKTEEKLEDRGFGLGFLGANALANYVVNSFSSTSTSTTFSTVTSTLTIGTIVTCYRSTMFSATTACRRKRRLLPGLLAGDDANDQPISPSAVEPYSVEPTIGDARQDKSFPYDTSKFLIDSSIKEEPTNEAASTLAVNRYVRQSPRLFGYGVGEFIENLADETIYVSTSVVTTFSLYTSSVTKTVSNLGATTVMSCLPSCFSLC